MSMKAGQPLRISDFLPQGMEVDDFYIIMAALATFAVIWAVGNAFTERDTLTPRLKAIAERRKELKEEYQSLGKRKKPEKNIDWMRKIVNKLKGLQDTKSEDIQALLTQAGYRSNSSNGVIIYMFGKITLPFVGLAIGVIVSGINWNMPFEQEEVWRWLTVIGGGFVGTKLPNLFIRNKRDKRYHKIRQALPDTLDLMMICAEAGLSLAAALDRVAGELGQTYEEMSEELGLTSVEMGFLPDRSAALKNFANRVDIQEVRGIVNILGQTEKYGTPVAQALRVLSKEFRSNRMMAAEQKAARLPALMTIPMIVFILPTLFIIVLSPAIIGLMDAGL